MNLMFLKIEQFDFMKNNFYFWPHFPYSGNNTIYKDIFTVSTSGVDWHDIPSMYMQENAIHESHAYTIACKIFL